MNSLLGYDVLSSKSFDNSEFIRLHRRKETAKYDDVYLPIENKPSTVTRPPSCVHVPTSSPHDIFATH